MIQNPPKQVCLFHFFLSFHKPADRGNTEEATSASSNPHGDKRMKVATGSAYTQSNSVSVPTQSHSPAHAQLQYPSRPVAPIHSPSAARRAAGYPKPRLTNGSATSTTAVTSAGTKRKRITRASLAANVVNVQGGEYHKYYPPTKPIAKSRDVHVEPISEVGLSEIPVCKKFLTDNRFIGGIKDRLTMMMVTLS